VKLPNGERAVIPMAKLRGYCLNPEHAEGRHKARVFASALGMTADDAEELQVALLAAARNDEAVAGEQDQYGQRYTIDFVLSRAGRTATLRSGWIIRNSEDFARLTSCYVDT